MNTDKKWSTGEFVRVYHHQYDDYYEQTGEVRLLIHEGQVVYVHTLFLLIQDSRMDVHYISLAKFAIESHETNEAVIG